MKSLTKKFVTGIKADAKGTFIKTIRYVFEIVSTAIADGLYFVFIAPLRFMPVRTLARVKQTLSPTTRLDYSISSIKLQADSLLDLYRARACEKEPETVEWIETYLKKGDVFFDIGANIGAYSLVACAHCEGEITVIAFEPSFSSFYQLCRNITVNKFQKSITPYLIALTKDSGLVSFSYHSLEAGSANHRLGDNTSDTTGLFVYTQQLLAFNMDHLVAKFGFPVPNHIKLDVDGAEVDVLGGAAETLRNNELKSILVEVRDIDGMSNQVDEILKGAGFQLVCKANRGDDLTWNCIYVRDYLNAARLTTIERNEVKK